MIQWEKDPYVRKHVHRWRVSAREWLTIRRVCEDCGERQYAHHDYDYEFIPGYEAVADLDWRKA